MGDRDRAAIPREYGGGLLHQSDRRIQCETWIMLMQMIASADAIGHWNNRSSAIGARTFLTAAAFAQVAILRSAMVGKRGS
jgi:hypothetical protein